MKEKRTLMTMAAVFLALSGFCWTVSIRTAGMPMKAAASRPAQVSSEIAPEEVFAGGEDEEQALNAEEKAALLRALAGAGTPFFDDPNTLTDGELIRAAVWYRMEMGKMPAPENGRVVLSEETVKNDILTLFGRMEVSFSEAGLGGEISYDPEERTLSLPAAALTPKLYARIESGESDTLTAALYPTEGWEGDVLGNRYLPAQSARGILTFQDGRISWKAG